MLLTLYSNFALRSILIIISLSLLHHAIIVSSSSSFVQKSIIPHRTTSSSSDGRTQVHMTEGPKLLEVFADKELTPGEWLSLKCTGTGNPLPQITWTLDGFPLDWMESIRTGDYVTNDVDYVISFVNISSVRPEHGGVYSCRAQNEISEVSNSAFIKVLGDPVVRHMMNYTIVAHTDLNIKCPVGGAPIDEIYWEKNGVRLPDNHRQVVHPNGTLIIKEVVRESDEGRYTCTATSKNGLSSKSGINVIIRVRPVIEPFILPKSVEMGQRLSITCTVIKGDPPISIKWMKDGVLLEGERETSPLNIRVHHLADYSSTLLFESLTPDQRGNYTCIASNDVGRSQFSADLVIYVPPEWVSEPQDIISPKKGDTIGINCQATGFPQPNIYWKKSSNSSSYKHVASSFRTQVLENGTLFIQDIQKSDSGLYFCRASNGVGTDLSKAIRITILDPPLAPILSTRYSNSSVISIEWNRPPDDPNPVTGFVLKVTSPIRNEVFEKTLSGTQRNITLTDLSCGTRYEFSMKAFNSVGYSEKSQVVNAKTTGSFPIAPDKESLIVLLNSTSVKLDLNSWRSGGCPIKSYSVKYKEQQETMWTIISNQIDPTNFLTVIDGLHPQSWYFLIVSASSDAGTSEAEYSFLTPAFRVEQKSRANSMETILYVKSSISSYFLEIEVFIPLILSVLMVIVVTSLICIVMRKRSLLRDEFGIYTQTSDGNTKQIPNLIMSELNDSNHSNNACGGFGGENNCSSSGCDKTKAKTVEEDHLSESPQAVLQPSLTHTSSYGSTSATTTFYPSPYASVTVTEGQLAAAVNGAHHFTNGHTLIGTLKPLSVLLEDRRERNHSGSSNISCLVDSPSHLRIETCESSPYATVKRTPRLAKTDRNIYDYPAAVALNQTLSRSGHTMLSSSDDPIPYNLVNFSNCDNCNSNGINHHHHQHHMITLTNDS